MCLTNVKVSQVWLAVDLTLVSNMIVAAISMNEIFGQAVIMVEKHLMYIAQLITPALTYTVMY